jgi:hypothetical protein
MAPIAVPSVSESLPEDQPPNDFATSRAGVEMVAYRFQEADDFAKLLFPLSFDVVSQKAFLAEDFHVDQ